MGRKGENMLKRVLFVTCILLISSITFLKNNDVAKLIDDVDEKSNASGCRQRTLKLSKTPLPIPGLVSFPGSGNTWVRHLIQQMTGIG